MQEINDIDFGTMHISAREEFYFNIIQKTKDNIISSCGKCDNGFIEKINPIMSVSDIASGKAIECKCRVKANKIAKRIYSGIPKNFIGMDNIELNLDSYSKETLELYIDNLTKVSDDGIGLLFIPESDIQKRYEINYARQLAAIKIITEALDNKFSAHYIDMNSLCEYQRKQVVKGDEIIESFLNEIYDVDFLCINNIGGIVMTPFIHNVLHAVISKRDMYNKPMIFVSSMNLKLLKSYLSEDIMELIKAKNSIVNISKYTGKVNNFPDIRKIL